MAMGDALKWLEEGFEHEVSSMTHSREGLAGALAGLDDSDAFELGRRGAREALAPLAWRAVAGEVLNTTQLTELLQISRQAIAKRVRHRSLLAIAGRGVSYFPIWQFDLDERRVRPVVKDVLDAFADALGDVDPLIVLSWARSPQHDELEGLTPQEWIQKDCSNEALKLAARRAAAALAT